MVRSVKIIITENSDIIRSGLVSILKGIRELNVDIFEVKDYKQLMANISWNRPDILIVSPSIIGFYPLSQLRKESGREDLVIFALQSTIIDPTMLSNYDDVIYVYEAYEAIKAKIISAATSGKERDGRLESLSEREKEVLVCIVNGMTNKQIAEKLFLSTHTVGTHRRNISSKLGIHSASGLTIYAIANKLVAIDA